MTATDPEARYWIHNYVLNSVLRGTVPSPDREYRFHFLRRPMIAFSEYDLTRQSTLAFVTSDRKSYGGYFDALHHWEQYLGAVWHTLETLRRMAGLARVFEKGSGSLKERVNALYNAMKHAFEERGSRTAKCRRLGRSRTGSRTKGSRATTRRSASPKRRHSDRLWATGRTSSRIPSPQSSASSASRSTQIVLTPPVRGTARAQLIAPERRLSGVVWHFGGTRLTGPRYARVS